MLLRFVVFLSVIVACVCIGNAVVFAVRDGEDASKSVYWLFFFIFAVMGLVLAWLSTKYKKLGYLQLSMWLGFELGLAFANMVFFGVPSAWIFWIIVGTGMVTVTAMASMNFNYHMIWVTAQIGSYILLQSVSLFIDSKWPLDLNLPTLYNVGATTEIDSGFKLYMIGWICLSALGIVLQCLLLWHFKKTGKRLHPVMKEAVDSFEHGKTAEERKKARAEKSLAQYCDNALGSEVNGDHESLYLDMESRSRS